MRLKTFSAQVNARAENAQATFTPSDSEGREWPSLAMTFRSQESAPVRALKAAHAAQRTMLVLRAGSIERMSEEQLKKFQLDEQALAVRHAAERLKAAFVSGAVDVVNEDGSPMSGDDLYAMYVSDAHNVLCAQLNDWFNNPRSFRSLTPISMAATSANSTPTPSPPKPAASSTSLDSRADSLS